MKINPSAYNAFLEQDCEPSDTLLPEPFPSQRRSSSKTNVMIKASLVLSFTLNILFVLYFTNFLSLHPSNLSIREHFYSPAQHLVTYHARRFTSAFGNEKSIYQSPPSPEKETSWRALYVEAFLIPRSEASRLHNKTVPISTAPTSPYVVGLNVFHYLHCLHYISNALDFFHYPESSGLNATYNPYDGVHELKDFEEHGESGMLFPEHLGHCVDTIRQALMCHADTTPYVWQPDSKSRHVNLYQETMHMCVDYGKLRDWAGERRFDTERYEKEFDTEAWKMRGTAGRCGYEEDCGEEGLPRVDNVQEERIWRRENRWMDSGRWVREEKERARNWTMNKGHGIHEHRTSEKS